MRRHHILVVALALLVAAVWFLWPRRAGEPTGGSGLRPDAGVARAAPDARIPDAGR